MHDPDELNDADLSGYAEEFTVDPAAPPPRPVRGPGGALGMMAWVLENPLRNGLLASVAGGVLAALMLAMALFAGTYLPFFLVIGCGMVPVGAAIAILPLPENAREKLIGADKSGGAGWFLWQAAVFLAFLLGGGGGLLLTMAL